MLWPALANGLPEVGLVPWGSSLFCVGGENDVSSAITEKALLGVYTVSFSIAHMTHCWKDHSETVIIYTHFDALYGFSISIGNSSGNATKPWI